MLLDRIPVGPGSPIQVPGSLSRLYDLAHNLWWSWDAEATQVWERIDPRRWSESQSPLSLLAAVELETWAALEHSASFMHLYQSVATRFDRYMSAEDTWYARADAPELADGIAYLSAEFGVHSTLPFYSGGLGVLAGDHAKAASDLGLPFVGVGLFYRRGYFGQEIDHDGDQQHHYYHIELTRRPVRPVVDRTGSPLRIAVDLPGRQVQLAAWRVDVGRTPLVLLDSDIAENDPADRPLTHILYVRGRETRLNQELVLGVGAVRLLDALEITPAMWHVNEGHAGFSLLERIARSGASSTADAVEQVGANTLFTLHTPVPAGNERFDRALVKSYMDDTFPSLDWETIEALGAVEGEDAFNLSGMCIRVADRTNAVSQRHGEVVTEDWRDLIGGPALAITNGVHMPTWVGTGMRAVFEKHVGADWATQLVDGARWKQLETVDDEQVWRAHETQKAHMASRVRLALREQWARHGVPPPELRSIEEALPPHRLTIVFARRFASYKRAGLLFTQRDRLYRLLTDETRPAQIIFAGKAHPADDPGKRILQRIFNAARIPEMAGRIAFVEDYGEQLAQYLVHGVDVWLNTPSPPMEASGTSGMKASINGVPHMSIDDGWWAEGYTGDNGWRIDGTAPDDDPDRADAADADALYRLLEEQVVPTFYDRDDQGVPHRWLPVVREAIRTVAPRFSARRMVKQYVEELYRPAIEASRQRADGSS